MKTLFLFDLHVTFQIPLLNSNATDNLSDGRLVRFRGMVQDMHNPEFYFEKFEVYNTTTNEVKVKSGKYCDAAHILVCYLTDIFNTRIKHFIVKSSSKQKISNYIVLN